MNTKIYSTKITVLIVLFNENIDLIFKTLNKLKSFKIIIVDNAGSYQNKKKLKKIFQLKNILLTKKMLAFQPVTIKL